MLILKSQKREIYQWIAKFGLEPSMFKWEIVTTKSDVTSRANISKLTYINAPYFFIFDFRSDAHHCTFSPGKTALVQREFPGSWDRQFECLKDWLRYLKREIVTVDPWDDIDKYMPGVGINLEDEKENLPFSYEQVEHITNALHKLKDEIRKSYNLDTGQDELVQEKLDYLIDRSKKIGRIDWKNIFVATLMGLAVRLAFNPEEVKGLWGLVKICFKGILLLGGIESG